MPNILHTYLLGYFILLSFLLNFVISGKLKKKISYVNLTTKKHNFLLFSSEEELFKSLKSYDQLKFDDFQVDIINPESIAQRKKRSADKDTIEELSFSTTRLKFHAFKRDFVIYLKRDLTLVSDKIDIEVRYSYKDKPDLIEHADNYFTSNNYIG